jgi:hypothetical protein
MRHPNGGGSVDDEAEARPAAYIDPDSRVIDRARAHSGRLISSVLAIEARLHNATVIRSLIACDEVTGGRVVECGLFQQSVVWDSPTLYRVETYDGVRIYGDAVLLGPMRLYGDARVLAGTWHRAPRYEHLGFCFLTESGPGWVLVDCKHAPYARWFRVGERFARRHYNWTPEMLAQVRKVLIEWSEAPYLGGVHWGRCVAGCARLSPSLADPPD